MIGPGAPIAPKLDYKQQQHNNPPPLRSLALVRVETPKLHPLGRVFALEDVLFCSVAWGETEPARGCRWALERNDSLTWHFQINMNSHMKSNTSKCLMEMSSDGAGDPESGEVSLIYMECFDIWFLWECLHSFGVSNITLKYYST